MKLSLSPETERLIEEKVSSGRYQSADEVVREGLERLVERDLLLRVANAIVP
jgi:antitoxin ParD1/3/4